MSAHVRSHFTPHGRRWWLTLVLPVPLIVMTVQMAIAQEVSWVNAICNDDPISASLSADLDKYAWEKRHPAKICDLGQIDWTSPNQLIATDLDKLSRQFLSGDVTIRNVSLVTFPVFLYANAPDALNASRLTVGFDPDTIHASELNPILLSLRKQQSFTLAEYSGLRSLAQALGRGDVGLVALSAELDRSVFASFRQVYATVPKDTRREVHLEPVADPADRFLWTTEPAIPFLVIRGPQAFAGADNVTDADSGMKGGVVALKRQEYDVEKPAPVSLAQRMLDFIIPPVEAYAPEPVPHRYPILLLTGGSTASLGAEFSSYLAKAYLRAVAKASIVAAHPCERPDVMPLVLAYLTAALDEQPADGSFRELLRAYQYLNNTSAAPQLLNLSRRGPGLVEQLEPLAGGHRCDVDPQLGFRHRLDPGMAEYQRALFHIKEALRAQALPRRNLQLGAACLTSLLRETQGQASKPTCEKFQRGLWFTYYEPFLATMIVLTNE